MVEQFAPIGVSGLRRFGGVVADEWLRALQGEKGRKVFREMADSDPVVGAILFATTNMLAALDWRVELGTGADPSAQEMDAVEFVGSCLHDMSASWDATLSEILTMLPYGFAPLNVVYKRRMGQEGNPSSKYDDGRIGWRKWSLRAQETIHEWVFDPDGGIQGLWQQPETSEPRVLIPIEALLLFRTTAARGNPEGRSMLRNAYRPWLFKKQIETIEGIGIERDLAGLPMAFVPPEIMASDASAAQQALYAEVQKIVTSIRNDEQGGLVMPMAYDDRGHLLYDLKLLSTGGAKQFDTDKVINRYDSRIAMTILADFVMLGHEKVGSFALSDSKTDMFGFALASFAGAICEVVNTHAIPRLLAINGMRVERMPELKHGDVESADLTVLGNFLDKMAGKGLLTPDVALEAHIRELAGLPAQEETAKA